MIARISTHFECTEEKFWPKIVEPKSLQFVAAPILSFKPLVKGALDDKWTVDHTYELELYLGKILPLGRHKIKLVKIDRESNTIVSHESGTFAPVWNHTIQFSQVGDHKIAYTDEIEIKAGWRTAMIWVFAHLFYRYRQKRWKKLLKQV